MQLEKQKLHLKIGQRCQKGLFGYTRYVNSKEKQKENIGPLLDVRGQLVTNNTEKAEVASSSFTNVVISTVGPQTLGTKTPGW